MARSRADGHAASAIHNRRSDKPGAGTDFVTASVGLGRPFGKTGIMGNGVLVTLVFQGVASGQSVITLPQVGLRDSKGGLIPLQSDTPPQAVISVR